MKVVIALTDQSFLRTKSMGIFNVSMGLTRGLMTCPEISELHVLGNNELGGLFEDCPPHVHLHLMDKPVPRRFARVWWDQFGVSAAIRKIAPDWAIFPKGFPPYFPLLGKTKLACYVHDVGWEYYEDKPAEIRNKAFPRHELMYFKRLSLRAMRMSDVVLTHTVFNESRIHAHEPRARVARIGIGFDEPAPVDSLNSTKKDVLTYASTFPHKRMDIVLARLTAWLQQRADAENIRIHLVGSLPKQFELPDYHWVHHSRMPFTELRQLMRKKCRMAVYVSDYESFGMPPVECLLNGVPCIASDFPSFHENLPESYIFPQDNEAEFIRTANEVYDGSIPFTCPEYPTWNQVAERCVKALLTH